MNKVIDKGFRSCRFVSTIVKHPVIVWIPHLQVTLLAQKGVGKRSHPHYTPAGQQMNVATSEPENLLHQARRC